MQALTIGVYSSNMAFDKAVIPLGVAVFTLAPLEIDACMLICIKVSRITISSEKAATKMIITIIRMY